MKDKKLYLVRITYTNSVLSDYFVGIDKVQKAIKRILTTQDNIVKIEYGLAPCRSKWLNWDKDYVITAYSVEV